MRYVITGRVESSNILLKQSYLTFHFHFKNTYNFDRKLWETKTWLVKIKKGVTKRKSWDQ